MESLPLLPRASSDGAARRSRAVAVALAAAFCIATLLGIALVSWQQSELLAELRSSALLKPQAVAVAPVFARADHRQSSPSPFAPNILIVYANGTHLAQLADAVRLGAERVVGADAERLRVRTVETASFTDDVMWADAVVLGSHVVNANVEPKMAEFMQTWSLAEDLSAKVGAVFVTGGGISAGEELTMVNLLHSLLIFRLVIVGGEHWTSAFGASAVVGEGPFEPRDKNRREDRDFPAICYPTDPDAVHAIFRHKAEGLGERVATIATRLAAAA